MSDQNKVLLTKQFSANIDYLTKQLRVGPNFDIIHHQLEYGGYKCGLFFVDGFAKDEVMVNIMRHLSTVQAQDLRPDPIKSFTQKFIPYIEVETTDDLEKVIDQVLAGQVALIVEKTDQAILLDVREYPARAPDEPDIERVVRGPRDGFVETLVYNITLIRRRIRDRSLMVEHLEVGKRSKTDVALVYIESIADPDLVQTLQKQIKKIKIDGMAMAEKTLEEFIFERHGHPYPMVRYTERADTSSTHLMEGHILIIVDGSPSVMICPTTFWHHLQHAEEYRQKPVVGAFLRWIRFAAVFASLFILPFWYLFAMHPSLLPGGLSFIGVEDMGELSLYWQFLFAEVGVEILRMAAIHTPSALATALGLVAAILIGEVAVDVGLFTAEVILYLALAAMGTFATPSYELSLANRIFRLIFLTAAALFGYSGLIVAILLWIILLATTKTMHTPYLWPFIPFDWKAFYEVLVRSPIPLHKMRPKVLDVRDPDNQ